MPEENEGTYMGVDYSYNVKTQSTVIKDPRSRVGYVFAGLQPEPIIQARIQTLLILRPTERSGALSECADAIWKSKLTKEIKAEVLALLPPN